MTPLEEIIREEIRASGPMRFDRFMELALYHPGLGYYAKPEGRAIGRKGDFYTSVSVGPLFGRLLARQFCEMWQLLGGPDPFWIIEQGAHDGQLARDILEWCRDETPDFSHALRYGIVQGLTVNDTTAFTDLNALAAEAPVGVFFSNELVDAFPVRVVAFRTGEWHERLVTVANDEHTLIDGPIADDALRNVIAELNPPEIEGYTTEISLRARDWIAEVGRAVKRGYILTIDYGVSSREYYAPHRIAGTLTAYAKHRRVDNVLANPGEQDITAHVDFTALARAGKKAGLDLLNFIDQQHFLTGIAHDELSGAPGLRAGVAENTRAFQTLTHPQHLGAKFHALVQAKDAPANLSGLRFARPHGL
jgi:SAM-dependent MidA family methyltransferase